jgi:hypothetical protein
MLFQPAQRGAFSTGLDNVLGPAECPKSRENRSKPDGTKPESIRAASAVPRENRSKPGGTKPESIRAASAVTFRKV